MGIHDGIEGRTSKTYLKTWLDRIFESLSSQLGNENLDFQPYHGHAQIPWKLRIGTRFDLATGTAKAVFAHIAAGTNERIAFTYLNNVMLKKELIHVHFEGPLHFVISTSHFTKLGRARLDALIRCYFIMFLPSQNMDELVYMHSDDWKTLASAARIVRSGIVQETANDAKQDKGDLSSTATIDKPQLSSNANAESQKQGTTSSSRAQNQTETQLSDKTVAASDKQPSYELQRHSTLWSGTALFLQNTNTVTAKSTVERVGSPKIIVDPTLKAKSNTPSKVKTNDFASQPKTDTSNSSRSDLKRERDNADDKAGVAHGSKRVHLDITSTSANCFLEVGLEFERMKTENVELRKQLDSSEKQLNTFKEELDTSKKHLASSNESNLTLKKELETLNKQVQDRVQDLQQKIDQEKKHSSKIEAEKISEKMSTDIHIHCLSSDVKSMKEKVEAEEKKGRKLTEELARVKRDNADLLARRQKELREWMEKIPKFAELGSSRERRDSLFW